jgi:CRISPR-associated protein Csd1
MILQSLKDYYDRKAGDSASALAPEGWESKEIPFVVVLDLAGAFVQLDDLREAEGRARRAKSQLVPGSVKRSVNIAANLLWDTVEYALGVDTRGKPERVRQQHEAFRQRLRDAFGEQPGDDGLKALYRFLDGFDERAMAASPAWKEAREQNAFVSFRLQGDTVLMCRRPSVRAAIEAKSIGGPDGMCLVTGKRDLVARLHPAIKGVRGGQSSGGNIVSFNLSAFASYGKEQGSNAPIGEGAARAYTTALNSLLSRNSRQKLTVGDATAVFWAQKPSGAAVEDAFVAWFDPPRDDPDAATERLRALYEFRQGKPLTENDEQRFFVLGLAPNAARVSVRFWHVGTVRELGDRIFEHFHDLEIVLPPNAARYPSLYRLLAAIVPPSKEGKIPPELPKLAGDWMHSILTGTPYPQTLLEAALRRCRAERDVGPLRAALIKASLNRSRSATEEEIQVSLDLDNRNTGYRLGRLFAAFEKIQEEANPGINATIRDRYFGSASASPRVAFPILNRLKNHHLAKLDNRGRAVNFERLIGEVMAGLDATNAFPPSLSLADQGRFAVGYYHQRQKLFEKTEGEK